jgi:uncharacterized protein YbjQ (UPF0145 family)
MDALIWLGFTIVLILIGYVFGKGLERAHFRSLARREAESTDFPVNNLKRPPADLRFKGAFLCTGSVVVASDYFKSFGAMLKSLIGGKLGTLETLLERGRREAILRMKAEARRRGADMVINTRIETSTIGRGEGNRGLVSTEVIAYGTGLVIDR